MTNAPKKKQTKNNAKLTTMALGEEGGEGHPPIKLPKDALKVTYSPEENGGEGIKQAIQKML